MLLLYVSSALYDGIVAHNTHGYAILLTGLVENRKRALLTEGPGNDRLVVGEASPPNQPLL